MSLLRRLIVAPSRTCTGIDKIVCLGKQYLEHARELPCPELIAETAESAIIGSSKSLTREELGDAIPDKPVIFNKFGSIAHRIQPDKILDLSDILPTDKGPVHYEAEICLQLGVAGSIEAVTLGLDLTLRGLQSDLKANGHPWEIAKCFPGSAVIAPWIPIEEFEDYLSHDFEFWLGEKLRQTGKGTQMRVTPEEAINYIESYFPLSEGDVVMTGTPKGVGEIQPGEIGELKWGDKLHCQVQF